MFAITELLTLFPLAVASWTHIALTVRANPLVYILIITLRPAQVSQVSWLCVHPFTLSKV